MSKEKIWHLYARKLSGEASQEELRELDRLCEEDATLLHEMQALQEFWKLPQEPDKDYMEATYLLHRNRMTQLGLHIDTSRTTEEVFFETGNSFFSKHALKLAAVALVLLLVFLGMLFQQHNGKFSSEKNSIAKQKEITTENGTKTFFKLPDGSSVWLNAGSSLKYTSMDAAVVREVDLTGEAFFDVVKDAKRPFIIHTKSVDIKVHGTQFNVKAYPGEKTVETSLIRGSVEVLVKNRPGESYLLKPNQKLVVLLDVPDTKTEAAPTTVHRNTPVVSLKNLTYQQGDTTAVEASWVQNRLVFEDEPFSEVALKMERWFDVEIEFRRKNVKEELLRGSFENESLEQALKALQFISTSNFKYSSIDG